MRTSQVTTPSIDSPRHTPEQMRKIAQEFESIFTSMMLKSMRSTVGEDPLVPHGMGEKIYTEMLDSEYSNMIGKHASLGLSDLLMKEMERGEGTSEQMSKLQNISAKQPWMLDNRFIPTGKTDKSQSVEGSSVVNRVSKWDNLISQASSTHNIDKNLVSAVIAQESGGNAYAVSRAGAKGLMQLMDTTAHDMGVNQVFSPAANIHGGTKYLKMLLDKFKGDERLALASYNAGPATVEKYGGIPPYTETRNYVDSVLKLKNQFTQNNDNKQGK